MAKARPTVEYPPELQRGTAEQGETADGERTTDELVRRMP